ncbi:unnamed protein product [Rotaria sordida]|uniref:beta-glucosidase n=1 Tax=Rotaria sordida TaxID=392033 RepID=A0A819EU40_9BILA|nr:unnamed protein product [Rotaria sordida]
MVQFAQGITAIQNSFASPDEIANSLYDQLTVNERLSLLDGDIECGTLLFTMGYQGYCRTPIPAGTIKRLGIPGILFTDGPRGITLGNSTAFPCSAARAATFDPALEEQIGIAIGKEARAQGANLYAGVCINLARHPGWGRAQESYGEDPIVLGSMGTSLARGAQEQVMVCVKHYALNSMENMRFTVNVKVDEKTLHEVYLPHFKMVVDTGVEILRDERKFTGFVMSDFFYGLRDGPESLKAGLDIEMPVRQVRAQTLPAALESGQLNMNDIKKSCIRILATELTYYAKIADQSTPSISVVGCVDHRHLARKFAAASMVVLKNDAPAPQEPSLLPLNRASVKKVAVIGKLANSQQTGDWGSSWVRDSHVVSPLSAFYQDTSLITLYNDGSNIRTAVETAKEADVTVVIVGYTGRDEGCEGGNALQDILWGNAEPSGRLPFVIPASEKDLPAWNPDAREVIYDRWWGYQLLNRQKNTPVYSFGFVYEENHEFEPSDSQKLTSHQTINRDDDDSNDHNLSIFKTIASSFKRSNQQPIPMDATNQINYPQQQHQQAVGSMSGSNSNSSNNGNNLQHRSPLLCTKNDRRLFYRQQSVVKL